VGGGSQGICRAFNDLPQAILARFLSPFLSAPLRAHSTACPAARLHAIVEFIL
jgi:hypothetical protein